MAITVLCGCGTILVHLMGGTNERWRAIFEVVASVARRELIVALIESPPHREVDLPAAANSPEDRIDPERLRLNLVHNHLPRMAEEGFIEWERDSLRARRGPRFDEVAAVIKAIDAYDGVPQHLTEGCRYFEEQEASS